MLRMWSVLWRENGHFTEVLTLMDIYVYFIVFCGQWCFVSCIQYILPLNLIFFLFINVFLHTANFCIQGSGRTLRLQKLSKYFKTEKGNDVLTNVWARMSV